MRETEAGDGGRRWQAAAHTHSAARWPLVHAQWMGAMPTESVDCVNSGAPLSTSRLRMSMRIVLTAQCVTVCPASSGSASSSARRPAADASLSSLLTIVIIDVLMAWKRSMSGASSLSGSYTCVRYMAGSPLASKPETPAAAAAQGAAPSSSSGCAASSVVSGSMWVAAWWRLQGHGEREGGEHFFCDRRAVSRLHLDGGSRSAHQPCAGQVRGFLAG